MIIQSQEILKVEQITRHFGGLTAVNQVSFTVNSHEIFGVIGPNGAGKTTLFNMITGLIPSSSGELIYREEKITYARPYQIAKRGIARTFQNLRLFKNLSVLDNVIIGHHLQTHHQFFADLFGLKPSKKQENFVIESATNLLELVGLTQGLKRPAGSLPYGDQRRLEIARALALKPEVLLLDEPVAGMNLSEKGDLSHLIKQLRDQFNLTILLIEHHVPLVMGLCDRIAVLDFGQLIALGDPETVRNDPAVIEAYLGDE